LGYRTFLYYELGWLFEYGPEIYNFARENRSRRKLHGNEEESKKEETLTVSEDDASRSTSNFTGLLREAPLEGLCFSGPESGARAMRNRYDSRRCMVLGGNSSLEA
jgi:hypothetical protein